MSRLWDRSHAARLRVALLTLVVFGLDTITNVDIVVSILYVNVVLLAMRSGRKSDVAATGCSTIVLTAVSYLMTMNAGHPSRTALLNSVLSVLAIACVTVLCLKNIASQGELLRARDRVALMSRGIVLRTISASVVHEVSQPLTAIGANAKAAQRWLDRFPPDVDETRAATRRIVAEADRAANVIGRLRRLMRPGDLSSEVHDVRGLIEAAIEHLRFEIDSVGADVTVACPASVTIEADGVLIEQVIVNALSNALDAMRTIDGGERAIRIEARSLPSLVKIAVKDSGMGVDEATLERMFDPFFTTKLDSGMGIGLAVSRSIIDTHGGSIRAFPNTPRGLIVELVLPAEGSRS